MMKESYHKDLRAIVRLLAFAIAKCYSGAEELSDWAYHEETAEESETPGIIQKFLSTDTPVHRSLKDEFIERFIKNKEQFPVEAVKSVILHMPYEEFLKTPYWKSISLYVKQRDYNRCTNCGSEKRLHVHHLNYQNHGDELHHLDNLICVCKKCHKEIHEKHRVH